MSTEKRKWRLQPNGDGLPLTIFDKPDDDKKSSRGLLNPIVINGIAIIVTLVWATSFLADILVKGYAPPNGIHLAFMVVLGSIFGVQILQGRKSE